MLTMKQENWSAKIGRDYGFKCTKCRVRGTVIFAYDDTLTFYCRFCDRKWVITGVSKEVLRELWQSIQAKKSSPGDVPKQVLPSSDKQGDMCAMSEEI